MLPTIKNITAHQIIDSRGNPTVEATVLLTDGSKGTASVPSGASTGEREAVELRDSNNSAYHNKGVQTAVNNIEKIIKPALVGQSPFNIKNIDYAMIELDGTPNKSRLGANAVLAVSLANIYAGADYYKQYLFEYIQKYINYDLNLMTPNMPIPMMNILNGGSHADNNVEIQEFMIMPTEFDSFSEALRAGVEIFHSLKKILKKKQYSTTIGDEGGFAPSLRSNEEALELIVEAISAANYIPGKNIFLALDVAASELFDKENNKYYLQTPKEKTVTSLQLIEYYQTLCKKYPIISIEDGLDQNDWSNWGVLTKLLGEEVQIVGDDLTVTNPQLLEKAINNESINAILIKLNQIGTFTETLDAIQLAQKNKLGVIISHRSGETEDTTIADLAVAISAGQIKTGSLCRTDRTAKYNQLLRIEHYLKQNVKYTKRETLGCKK
tara:strand:+ start:296 stop:1612 length:1317 start_codon:yes stop_codon:yes gene_type:complete